MSRTFQHPFQESQFDIFDWYPRFQSCLRYFCDHAQYTTPVQAVASYVNIRLPFQHADISRGSTHAKPDDSDKYFTIVPYVRRLVVTGFDSPAILTGFFGDDWVEGIGAIHEAERRNYLFAAKSDNWLKVKASYDMENGQTVPFLRPLQGVDKNEITCAESHWSDWLAMQDWMLGPLAPQEESDPDASHSKHA